MNAAPTICRACGGVIKTPNGWSLCDLCRINDGLPQNKDICRGCGAEIRPAEGDNLCAHCRAYVFKHDSGDLTQKLWAMSQRRHDRYWIAGEWLARGLGLFALTIIAYWLLKQLL